MDLVEIELKTADGTYKWRPQLPPGVVIESLSLLLNTEPIVRVPFHAHENALHTICGLNGEIDRIES